MKSWLRPWIVASEFLLCKNKLANSDC